MPENLTQNTRRSWSRFLQIKLSWMLILICVFGSIFGWYFRERFKRQEVANWLQKNNIQFWVRDSNSNLVSWNRFAGPPLNKISSIRIYGSVDTLRPLKFMPNLREVSIGTNPRSSSPTLSQIEDLTPLLELTKLDTLELAIEGNRVDLSELSQIKSLRHLCVNVGYKTEGLDSLKQISHLETLQVVKYFCVDNFRKLSPDEIHLSGTAAAHAWCEKLEFHNAVPTCESYINLHILNEPNGN